MTTPVRVLVLICVFAASAILNFWPQIRNIQFSELFFHPEATFVFASSTTPGTTLYLPLQSASRGEWTEVGPHSATAGGISDTPNMSTLPSIAVGLDGSPIVAWKDGSLDDQDTAVYVKRWNGEGWVEMGAGSASGEGISGLFGENQVEPRSLAIGPDGNPIIAWRRSFRDGDDFHSGIYVRRWDGSQWVEMGPGSASGSGISGPVGRTYGPLVLSIAPDGTPIVAWTHGGAFNGTRTYVYLRYWNGTQWLELGAGSASGDGISGGIYGAMGGLSISYDHGMPVVFWSGGNWVFVKRWNGSEWVEMGSGSASPPGISGGVPDGPSVGEISSGISPDGYPIAAWQQLTDYHLDLYQVYVRKWDGYAWVELGPGSASGEGISKTGHVDAYGTSLIVAPDGTVIVSWAEHRDMFNSDIYVKYWNGSQWQAMGYEAASAGGISNNGLFSVYASMAISPAGTPLIAWADASHDWYNGEIYVRKWGDLR